MNQPFFLTVLKSQKLAAAISLGLIVAACNQAQEPSPTSSVPTPLASEPSSASPGATPPAVSSMVSAAAEREATVYMGSMARAQQAFYLEQAKFAATIKDLLVGIPEATENYQYQIVSAAPTQVQMTAIPKKDGLKSFLAAVFIVGKGAEGLPQAITCGTDQPSKTPPGMPAAPKAATEALKCPAGSSIAK
ncbi:hypothetical protein BST81_17680 [Leptolyngbya sp. 'hensonii']|uniref:type IV pilin-like G/H family protein n=1 Tax=Leptolyngbya sp. 'hensonii' TaxID=1922337 RepID=UPI00094F95E2|nr:type IV pilin-like G/H family protein [Leptolyngbya sp. 'hensonii']OLP17179.1 hypothetical protein BST81_17680 [Leptolyngbya sp. 'hensonii']